MRVEEETLAMELVTTVYSIPKSTEATRLCHCGEEALKEGPIERGMEMHEDGDDGFEIAYAESPRCCLIVPPAIPIGRASTIDARVFGINRATTTRLVVQQHSEILVDKLLQRQELISGTIKCVCLPTHPSTLFSRLDLPELYEGTVTFYLIGEDGWVYGVPVCVVPEDVVPDVEELFSSMISVTRRSMSASNVTEDALLQFVWRESFSSFLGDMDVLFGWLDDGHGPVDVVMDIFVNMLRQCCLYEAWEFGAYVVNKAAECGVEIISGIENATPFTASSLKASVCHQDQISKDEQTNTASDSKTHQL